MFKQSVWAVLCLATTLNLAAPSRAAERIVPAKGIAIPAEVSQELEAGLADFQRSLAALKQALVGQPKALDMIADAEIYYNAVRYALDQQVFYDKKEFEVAKRLLAEGRERAEQISGGQAPWAHAKGLVVRGYYSRIDGSAQPYGLEVPDTYDPANADHKHRLDLWYHGRNDKLTELRFIDEREKKHGPFSPADTFILHPYGRFCNAMKYAGEVDTFEALEHAQRNYPIDGDRLVVRGFSMGGAATWHIAAQHAGTFVAASPGAGFAETAIYQKVFTKGPQPAWWEQKLWNLTDATVYCRNLYHCPLLAYSGEIDPQKESADIMEDFMKREGMTLNRVIGPGMGHKYDDGSKVKIEEFVTAAAAKPRDPVPPKIQFTTYTLRYNRMLWITVEGLDEHWTRADIDAAITNPETITVTTKNISAFTIDMPEGHCPLKREPSPSIIINGQRVVTAPPTTKKAYTAHFQRTGDQWSVVATLDTTAARKLPGSQGPIDDAFMDSFVFVTPTGKPMASEAVTEWIEDEQANAAFQWWMQFRGRPRIKKDTDVNDHDIASSNLVLWGDPSSNAIFKRVAPALPLQLNAKEITLGPKTYAADGHVPVMIYPNPLNPKHYVVINSGFTFAENGAASNSTQTSKLPDWAILDIATPRSKRIPAGVVDCDFFGERWNYKTSPERK